MDDFDKIARKSKLTFSAIGKKASEKKRIETKLPRSLSRPNKALKVLSTLSRKIAKKRKREITSDISEESFDLEHRVLQSSVGCKGKNNPISNGKMHRILNQLIDEAIVEKKYMSRYQKLYARKLTNKLKSSRKIESTSLYSRSRIRPKRRPPAFPFKFEDRRPQAAKKKEEEESKEKRSKDRFSLIPKIRITEDQKPLKRNPRESVLISQIKKSNLLKMKKTLEEANKLSVTPGPRLKTSDKKVSFNILEEIEPIPAGSIQESTVNSEFSEDPDFFEEIERPVKETLEAIEKPQLGSKFHPFKTFLNLPENGQTGQFTMQPNSPDDLLGMKKVQTVSIGKLKYFDKKPPKKKNPNKIYKKLQKNLDDFEYEFIPPVKYSKPTDPFGFLARQKILQQDVPQHEILPPQDDIAAQTYTAPMLGRILEKYQSGSPREKKLPPMSSRGASPLSSPLATPQLASPPGEKNRMTISEQNFYKPNAEKAIAKDFKEKTRIDMFDKIFKRKSYENFRKGCRAKGRKQAVDYFTKNNINKVLDDIV